MPKYRMHLYYRRNVQKALKEAQVVPLHKKNDPLDKKNYRPVSILPKNFKNL
jgi:hypothetical protein